MKLPEYKFLVPVALLLGFAPFYPQPHIVEKLLMLSAGALVKPLDIFDLLWHAWPFLLIGCRLVQDLRAKAGDHTGVSS